MSKPARFSPRFEPVSPRYDAPSEEERVLAFWEKEQIFARSVTERPAERPFIVFEGPPTANGKPGIHHVEARAFKDLIPRYQTMRGRRVERKAGWDTHGLPVELQVEKQLGISGKPQIETLVPGDVSASIARFNELCKQSVWQYKDEWEKLTKRLGYWVDLEHPYVSYENSYIESVWWILKQLWDKQLLYEDFKVVPYCPRCGTALSSHEVAQGYEETTDRSVYVKFSVKDRKNTYLLAWTTTPWTLPGNVALAIGRDILYGRYSIDDAEYIIADDRAVAVLGPSAIRSGDVSAPELTALRYEPLFAVAALAGESSYRVYLADFVTTDSGTGIVHTAVMYGEDDFQLGSKIGLPKHHTVDFEGKFTTDVPDFTGRFVKDETTDQQLVDYLREGNALLREEPYTHSYPFCWRCQTPLIYYAKRSWFIKMSSLRDQLLERNATVRWVPANLRDGRFGDWLREVKDWALSRDRYWGTPLPIWRCQGCGATRCVGSLAELTQLAGSAPDDLHKPFIDDVHFACESCGRPMARYPEVIDVWFDSGSMPFAQWHYPFDPASNQRVDEGQNYPADYIAEALDQTRGWFYTLLAVATALGRPAPYKSVISVGFVLDKDGKKMSKSRGNVIDPWTVINTDGADALRLYMYAVNQADDVKKLDPLDITQVLRKTFLILWNMYGFFAQRAEQETSERIEIDDIPVTDHVLDAWVVARTNQLIQAVTDGLDSLDAFHASRAITDYITELSTWYLKHSRTRTNASFLPTLGWALRQLALVMAPFTPFFAETLWQRLRSQSDPVSVHLADWPAGGPVDEPLLVAMQQLQRYVELGLAERARHSVKVRQPLAGAVVTGDALSAPLTDVLAEALNVKSVRYQATGDDRAQLSLDLTVTAALKLEGVERELTRTIQVLRKQAGLVVGQPGQVTVSGDHPLVAELTARWSAIGEATGTTIGLGDPVGEHRAIVETLTVSLVTP